MRISRSAAAVLVLCVVASTPTAARSQPPAVAPAMVPTDEADPLVKDAGEALPTYAADRVVVRWREPARAADGARAQGLQQIADVGSDGAVIVATAGRAVDEVLAELRANPAVEWAEPDYLMSVADEVAAVPVDVNDPLTDQQYALDLMHVREAWSIKKGGSNVVAVIDTGVWAAHPDLAGRLVAGYDFVNDDSNPADDNAHGTWVSGIIAANVNDGSGIAGISWTDKIMPVKVMNHDGLGSTSDVVAGIHWAVDHGASVINLSIGGFGDSQLLREAIDYAWDRNVVLVAAAGNFRSAGHFYPASYPQVISVTATQADDEFTNWSNFGTDVDVSAPGGSVLTTNCNKSSVSTCKYTGSHIVISGTSFSSPNVAGVVALLRAKNPTWSNASVVARIKATATDLGYPGWDNRYGHGRVNASRALGGITAPPAASPGDGHEQNNAFTSARLGVIGTTYRPSIHPAGDVDFFAFNAPRAGRLDLTVTPVIDSVRPPKSSLPVDPVLHVYNAAGTLLKLVDNADNSAATEVARIQVAGAGRIVLRVSNWFPNGNRTAYSVTAAFVDNVLPTVTGRSPGAGTTGVPFNATHAITFSETVSAVSASTVVLRDAAGHNVPATVTYDPAKRRAHLKPKAGLAGEATYRISLSSAIVDLGGNALVASSYTFTTGKADRRLAGADRYATAAAVSAAGFAPGVPVAYVATGATFPDALAAGPVAARAGGPILLVSRDQLPAATRTELSRLKPAKIVVLGGTGVVSAAVASALRSYATGGTVTRLAGADRYATAAAVSASAWAANGPATVFVATGQTFADALAAVPYAGRLGVPLLLTASTSLSSATAAELLRLDPSEVKLIGGTASISDHVKFEIRALWN